MEEAKAILILATAVLVPLAICLAVVGTVGYVDRRIAAHFALTRRYADTLRSLASLLALLILFVGVIVAMGAVANAEARSKAEMLARGIAEALTCTPLVLRLLAAIVGVVGLVSLTRRWTRPS